MDEQTQVAPELRQPKRARGAPEGNRNNRKSGYYAAKAAISEFGSAVLDGRSAAAKLVAEIEEGFYADKGGKANCSTAERILIRLCSKDVLFLNGIDCHLLQQPTLVLKRKKTAIPLLEQRNRLAAGLAQRLGQLGLERRAAPVPSLQDYLARKDRERAAQSDSTETPSDESKQDGDGSAPEYPGVQEPPTERDS